MTGVALRTPMARLVLPAAILLLAVVGLLVPLSPQSSAAAAVLTLQTSTLTVMPVGAMGMTNVARIARGGSDCATPTTNGICATLFTAGSGLVPGRSGAANGVTITYTGGNATADFRLYATNYTPRTSGSSVLCTAPPLATDPNNPGTQIELQVLQGPTIIFPVTGTQDFGTLQSFARTFTGPATGLALRGGTDGSGQVGRWTKGNASTFTINLRLAAGATNAYQGCNSAFDFVWFASQ